jgi:hypothetical protein
LVVGSGYTIKALDESNWDAFARLVEANNGVFGGCWCMGFHSDDSREPALNRERKLARVRAGTAHAALVFDGNDCVGWCQFGAPDEVPKIKNRAAASVPAGFLFNGALSTYEKLGFVRDRKIGKHRWVVTRVVEPAS